MITSPVSTVNTAHYEEFKKSAIADDLIALNFREVGESEAFELLCYGLPDDQRRNDGRLRDRWLRRYNHLAHGGWYCAGVDLVNGGESDWGCLKPNQPRMDKTKGKPIKYEHPAKVGTGVFALRVSERIWKRIAQRFGLEMPSDRSMGFWAWVINTSEIPLVITEGAKKAAALLSAGYAAIALPGIWNGIRTEKDSDGRKIGKAHLIPELKLLATKGRKVFFAYDEDKKRRTRRDVARATQQASRLLAKAGCQCLDMAWDNSQGKGADDFLARAGEIEFHRAFCQATPVNLENNYAELTLEPNRLINRRYFQPEDLLAPHGTQLLLIKGGKGTGKTQAVRDGIVRPILENFGPDSPRILNLTHRISLGRMLTQRCWLQWVGEHDSAEGSTFGLGLCVNSILKLDPDEWIGRVVLLDEVVQFCRELLNSNLMRRDRVAIVERLSEILTNASLVVGMDADLDDTTVNFLKALMGGNPRTFYVENAYQGKDNSYDFTMLEGRDGAKAVAITESYIKEGKNIFACCGAQALKSKFSTSSLEQHFRKKYPDLSILRLDAETIAEPGHPAFGMGTGDISKLLEGYQLVLASSSIETGASIELPNHYSAVVGIFGGLQPVDSVRQFLMRVRDVNAPRFIWAKTTGFKKVGNGATFASGLLSGIRRKAKVTKELSGANQLLSQLLELEQAASDLLDESKELVARASRIAWARYAAHTNQGKSHYRKSIEDGLIDEGHQLKSLEELLPDFNADKESLDALRSEVTQTQEQHYSKHYDEVSQSNSPDDKRYEVLDRQPSKTKAERLEHRKGQLKRRYGVEVAPELVEKDDSGWHPKIKLHYLLTANSDTIDNRDARAYKSMSKSGGAFLFDAVGRFSKPTVETLKFLGVPKLLESREILSNAHPLVVEIADKARQHATDIKNLAGITINPDPVKKSNIQTVQSLLALIGFKMPALGRKGGKGNQVRQYGTPGAAFETEIIEVEVPSSVTLAEGATNEKEILKLNEDGNCIPLDDGRQAVFEAWVKRDEELLAKTHREIEEAREQLNKPVQVAEPPSALQIEATQSQVTGHEGNETTECLTYEEIRSERLLMAGELSRLRDKQNPQPLVIEALNLLAKMANRTHGFKTIEALADALERICDPVAKKLEIQRPGFFDCAAQLLGQIAEELTTAPA